MKADPLDFASEGSVGCESHFLDSGSFSLWTKAAEYAKEHGKSKYAFYRTQAHWDYVDAYAAFIKKYCIGIDLYANVDVIPDRDTVGLSDAAPTLTFRNQQYLEDKHGLEPVPVVHYKEDLSWLQTYIDRSPNLSSHGIIALGGLVGAPEAGARAWLDRAFAMSCDRSGMVKIKLHGFGVTNYDFLIRYPWWSVDSASWTKVGAYGGILVPHKRQGQFVFFDPTSMAPIRPYLIKTAREASRKDKKLGVARKAKSLAPDMHTDRQIVGMKHYLSLTREERKVVREWLDEIGVPLGKVDDEGTAIEMGVVSRHSERKAANLHFFEKLRKSLPDWPWKFRHSPRKGLVF